MRWQMNSEHLGDRGEEDLSWEQEWYLRVVGVVGSTAMWLSRPSTVGVVPSHRYRYWTSMTEL